MKFRIFNNSYFNSFTIRSTTNNNALLFYFLGLLAREIIVMHIYRKCITFSCVKKRNVLLSEPKQILDSTAFLMYSLIL